MIAVENLHKSYAGRIAVGGVSFAARDGEITGLLGSNGAGKTTTLRMIAGVLQPDSGMVHISGGRGALGALLDHAGLYGRLTARENIAYFAHLRGLSGVDGSVDRVLGRIGLRAIADRPAAGLSQGERMKVALGRALVHSPQNILLDEPTNGLDIPTVRSFRDLLRSMRDAGCSIILSSHVLEDIRTLCDRIVVISHGSVAAEGTPGELCEQAGYPSLEDAYLHLTRSEEVAAC